MCNYSGDALQANSRLKKSGVEHHSRFLILRLRSSKTPHYFGGKFFGYFVLDFFS
jgi:hypothetical protein